MKKFVVGFVCVSILFGSGVIPTVSAFAAETEPVKQISEANTAKENLEPGVSVVQDEDGTLIVTKSESRARAHVSRWGGWSYTNIAVTTGVAANAINAAFYAGLGASVAMFGIPGWVIGGLLTGASWTSIGASPGNAVAKKWDKNKNGWIGFYKRTGYDGAGRAVATQYKTE